MTRADYIPALRFEFLTKFYDPLVRYSTREAAFKNALIRQANLKDDLEILDIACGTGTLLVSIKQKFPKIDAKGFDIDEEILKMAKKKLNFHALKSLSNKVFPII